MQNILFGTPLSRIKDIIFLFEVPLSMIKEVRSGKNTEVFRTIERDDIPEDCAFSVIHGENFISLDLIATSPDDANIWITGLRCLLDSDISKFFVVLEVPHGGGRGHFTLGSKFEGGGHIAVRVDMIPSRQWGVNCAHWKGA